MLHSEAMVGAGGNKLRNTRRLSKRLKVKSPVSGAFCGAFQGVGSVKTQPLHLSDATCLAVGFLETLLCTASFA